MLFRHGHAREIEDFEISAVFMFRVLPGSCSSVATVIIIRTNFSDSYRPTRVQTDVDVGAFASACG